MVRPALRTLLVTSAFACAAACVALACDDAPIPQACTNIPVGGCPRSRGVACEDPACEAVYLCRADNVWELDERCPVREAGPPIDAGVDDAEPTPFDASIDAPPGAFGGPGCEALQAPDCSLGIALSCGPTCCGCEDVYICEEDGWTLWGACGDGGLL